MTESTDAARGRMGRLFARLRSDVRSLITAPAEDRSLRREVQRWLNPVLEREHLGLREWVMEGLGTLMELERERRARRLETLARSSPGREQLPTLLDTIADQGGFVAVLLTDEVGLPLAASRGAQDADVLAGMSSLIITLADRFAKADGHAPVAVLVRDDADKLVLHRIFSVADERYLLTAVCGDADASTTALDPVLTTLQDTLAKRGST